MKLAEAIALVTPFVSTDETRLHLTRPARHPMHVVGTDGHTLACVRTDDPNENDIVRTWVGTDANGTPVPRFEYVVPAAPKCFGLWNPALATTLPHYPTKWITCVRFGGSPDSAAATAEAWLPARMGARGKVLRPKVHMIREQAIDGFDEIRAPERIGVDAGYLVRVADLFDNLPVYVYGNGPLDPLVFCKSSEIKSAKDLLAGPGFAIVMPIRI